MDTPYSRCRQSHVPA